MKQHPSHEKQIGKINRAIGQLEAVKRMIEERQYCVDIINQLRAARNATKGIEFSVLETHMNACVRGSCCGPDKTLQEERFAEIITLLKKYE